MKTFTLTPQQLAEFFTEFYALKLSNISDTDALNIIAQYQDNKIMQGFISTLMAAPNLITGLEQTHIPEYIIALLKHNKSNEIFIDIAQHFRVLSNNKTNAYSRQIAEYLFYPMALLILAGLLTLLLLIFVIPTYEDLFNSIGYELPKPTVLFIQLSHYTPLFIAAFAVILLFSFYLKTDKARALKSKLLMTLPLIKTLMLHIESIAIINALYLLQKNKFSFHDSLILAASATKNTVINQAIIDSAKQTDCLNYLTQRAVFSKKALHLLNVFNKTLGLTDLADTAQFVLIQTYSDDTHKQIQKTLHSINILLLFTSWLIIGFMIIALYLPIFQVGAAIG
ncbi:Putative type II secretion system protein F [Patescibacteria group bacterium]|nr:Putative type II secretion system protein F [Patescibacteria group bacterium]